MACPRPPTRAASVRELTLVAGLSLLALLLSYAFLTERAGLFKDDTRHYALMAEDPAYLARLPYAFRVLVPLLVHLLPFGVEAGFTLVTLASLWLSALVLYAFLRRLGLSGQASVGGLLLFLFSGATIRLLTTPLYIDAPLYLTELLAFYALLTRREALFGATLLVGVLNRETALLLAPVYLLEQRAAGRLGRQDLPRVALVLGLPFLALALLVVGKLALAGAFQQGFGALRPLPRTFYQNVPSFQDLSDIYTLFGAGWLLAAAGLRGAPPILRHGLAFGLLIVAQLSVSRGDESRNLSHLLPLVIPLAAVQLERQAPPIRWALVAACLASVVNFRWTILPWAPLRYGLVAAGTLLALALQVGRLARRNRASTSAAGRSEPDAGPVG